MVSNNLYLLHDCEDAKLKEFGIKTLTSCGHMTSSVTWPFDSPWALSHWWSMMTMHLSGTVMELWQFKANGVTTLIFWGHVTSSVTWPFDSRCATSYGTSVVTMHLHVSCTVMELRHLKCNGSRVWPFEVTWRHRSRDHSIRRGHFSIGGQW